MDDFVDELGNNDALEQELRQSLSHVPPPEGFADRVMARLAEREQVRPMRRNVFGHARQYGAWWAGIAAALVMTVGAGDALHVRHQRHEREAAAVQAQMDMAMQLTNHALYEVQTGLDRSPAGRFSQLWNGTEK